MDAPTKEMLFKEYDICIKEASRLEANIWQTAALFSIGSGVGFSYFLKEFLISKGDYIKLGLSVSLFAFLVIIISLVWWRMARRWWSIQHLKYERIRKIEDNLGFSQVTMVNERDTETMQHIKSYRFIHWFRYQIPRNITPKRCDDITKIENYEHRGIQPAIKLLLFSNAILWLILIIFSCGLNLHYSDLPVFIIFISLLLIMFVLYFWRQR
jgi:hypothetical protein